MELFKQLSEQANSHICGFILYGKEHGNVLKVIEDKIYWDELDAISGDNWPIFVPNPLKPKRINYVEGNDTGLTSIMLGIETEPKTNKDILNKFGLEDSNQLPCFIIFSWDDNGDLQSEAYKIYHRTLESTHSSL